LRCFFYAFFKTLTSDTAGNQAHPACVVKRQG
jgi:hypothetical protein